MQYRWRLYLLSLIWSYLILIKFGLNSIVQPIRLLLTGLILIEAIIYLSNFKVHQLRFPSLWSGLFAVYLILVMLVFPMNLVFNLGSVVKYSSYMLVFLAAYNGLNIRTENLFSRYFFYGLYAVSFYQIFAGDTEYINMAERVSGVYYRHSSGMALMLTILIGHILYKSRDSWKYLHLLIIGYLLIKTGSRTGVIAVVFSLLFVEVVVKKNWKVFLSFLFLGFLSSYYLLEVIRSFSSFDRFVYLIERGNDASTMARIEYFNRAIQDMSVSLFGNGLGSFAVLYEEFFGKRLGAHNNFLLFLIELGFFGVILYCIHLAMLFFRIIKLNNPYILFIFFAFYVGGSLNNNYYYPAGMIIFFAEFGKSLSNGDIYST